jgi:long-chain-fatty-acid--[acyl-carrier-protein] ligase
LANGAIFTPRRQVTIELYEPTDLPRNADRNELNNYLETFYNEDAPPRTYVPYTIWERSGPMQLPEPQAPLVARSPEDVPDATRRLVADYLRELTGFEKLRDEDKLAYDLGMDSLTRADLVVWLAKEFGVVDADVDGLQTVGDVMLAACREVVIARPHDLKPVPAKWFRGWPHERIAVIPCKTITEAFLAQAARHPKLPVIADQLSGVKTYRDIIVGIFALRPIIERIKGERIGIMLPASVAADVVYLSCLFAGKTPVMVNWTTGSRDLVFALDSLGVKHVLSAGGLVARIEAQGTDLSAVKDRLVLMENVGREITLGRKLRALAASRLSWARLRSAHVSPVAAILLTSGSETQPKAVPLTHANILGNLNDVLKIVRLNHDDCLVAFLPPFHSFGLSVTMILPLAGALRAVYHTNPTESALLARIIEAYKANMLVGTPTFLGGIVRAARPGQLDSLRLAVTGAEKCTPRTYEAIAECCPKATILEGYGITECSPIVAANGDDNPQPYTIGRMLPSLEYAIVNVDTWQSVGPGEAGLLLVRGPSVFGGYVDPRVASPFVEFKGRQWYRTGDLVSQDEQGMLTFRGRLKRFVKIGGEMISLPAIEAALEPLFVSESDEGPVLAVEATPDENHPELILFTTKPADRQTANRQLRDAGLSPLHNISRIVQLDAIPVLGTGKTDYRALRQTLAGSQT